MYETQSNYRGRLIFISNVTCVFGNSNPQLSLDFNHITESTKKLEELLGLGPTALTLLFFQYLIYGNMPTFSPNTIGTKDSMSNRKHFEMEN